MDERLYADRAALRCLIQTPPLWTYKEWATHLGRSLGWVKKWVKRLRAAPPDDRSVLWSRLRAHKASCHTWSDTVIARILEMRDQAPASLAGSVMASCKRSRCAGESAARGRLARIAGPVAADHAGDADRDHGRGEHAVAASHRARHHYHGERRVRHGAA
jgi:hypothetical protein